MTLPEALVVGTIALVCVAAFVFWIAMIRDCWRRTVPGTRKRWVWLAIVVLGEIPGAVAYYLLREELATG